MKKAEVIESYTAQNTDELSLEVGEIVTVIAMGENDNNYWAGSLNGALGSFPSRCVTLLPDEKKPSPPPIPPPPTPQESKSQASTIEKETKQPRVLSTHAKGFASLIDPLKLRPNLPIPPPRRSRFVLGPQRTDHHSGESTGDETTSELQRSQERSPSVSPKVSPRESTYKKGFQSLNLPKLNFPTSIVADEAPKPPPLQKRLTRSLILTSPPVDEKLIEKETAENPIVPADPDIVPSKSPGIREEHRKKVVAEIISTEKDYVRDLHVVIDVRLEFLFFFSFFFSEL
jgi:hypothetical protein